MPEPRPLVKRIPPPLYFFACLLAGGVLHAAWPLSLGLEPLAARLGVALSLFGLATCLGLWALWTFGRGRTSPLPFGTPATLLTAGPFRLSRNPLYVALVLTLAAFAALLDAAWVLAFVPLLALALDRFVIPDEEATLRRVFAEPYAAYSARVRRWL